MPSCHGDWRIDYATAGTTPSIPSNHIVNSLGWRGLRPLRSAWSSPTPGPRGGSRRRAPQARSVPGQTALVTESDGRSRWWTFGGLHANAALAAGLRFLGANTARLDNFSVGLDAELPAVMMRELRERAQAGALWSPVDERAVTGLKFNECLPPDVAERILETPTAE